jgi:hypothetical protein
LKSLPPILGDERFRHIDRDDLFALIGSIQIPS